MYTFIFLRNIYHIKKMVAIKIETVFLSSLSLSLAALVIIPKGNINSDWAFDLPLSSLYSADVKFIWNPLEIVNISPRFF